jgi:hypothetical protein
VDALENISCICRESKHSSSDEDKPVVQSLAKYYQDNKIKEDYTDEACGTYGGRTEIHTVFSWGNPKVSDHRRKWNNNNKTSVNEIRRGLDLSGYRAAGKLCYTWQ